MNALTLTEPWASLVAAGGKSIETRGWPASPREIGKPLAIHAAKKLTLNEVRWAAEEPRVAEVLRAAGYPGWPAVPALFGIPSVADAFAGTRGRVPAVGRLVACLPTGEALRTRRLGDVELSDDELRFGDFSPGRWAWVLEDVEPLAPPVPATGRLWVWQWDG